MGIGEKIGRRISMASAVIGALYQAIVVKGEKSRRAKLSMYQSVQLSSSLLNSDRKKEVANTSG